MNSSLEPRPHRIRSRGFALLELAAVIMTVALLLGIWKAALAGARERAYVMIDQSNVRQILRASALYNAENNDHMAHPTWGGDLTGPDGWAYLTSQRNRPVPGALTQNAPSCIGVDVNSVRFTNQLAFFKAGQVTQYLPDVKTAWCPKNVATRKTGRLKSLWLERPVKVTSYTWNGTIGGYVGPRPDDLKGKTYTISQFLPSDWQFWEENESTGFNFNDAASNPENPMEGPSLRHSGAVEWWTFTAARRREYSGGLIVGTFGGAANFVRWPRVYDITNRKIPAPNPIFNGPLYSR